MSNDHSFKEQPLVGLGDDNAHHASMNRRTSYGEMADIQLNQSPSRSVRRDLPNDSDDDNFQLVTCKKPKHLTNSSNGDITSRLSPLVPVVNKNTLENMNVAAPIMSNDQSKVLNDDLNLQKQSSVTRAATRYALTRYPFPPHIVRFNSKKITTNRFKEFVTNFFKSKYNINIEIVNCRFSTLKCTNDEMDILLYVKDPASFAFLLDHTNWPETICDEKFIFPSVPPTPPQLSLIIKNVDIRLDFDEFSEEVRNLYPGVEKVIRMKNRFGYDIKLVKLELTSIMARNKLLNNKKVFINYICYDIDEYLAPVNVLICSKCCGIGHFRRQCTEADETCKSCGVSCKNLKDHQCSSSIKCKHCSGDHFANSMKCPVVKSFRDALTKNLLNYKSHDSSYPSASLASSSSNENVPRNSNTDFPRLPNSWMPSDSHMDSKINLLISGLTQVNNTLMKLCDSDKSLHQFVVNQKECNMKFVNEIDGLKSSCSSMNADLLSIKGKNDDYVRSVKEHDTMFQQFLFPLLDDCLHIMGTINLNKNGRTLDADLRSRLERYRAHLSNAIVSKSFI